MTKNTTRKGLALGAAAALVAAGFVGSTPAYAAFATLDASFGTSGATQNGLLGKTFNLAATTDNRAATKFYVTGADDTDLVVSGRFVTSKTSSQTADTVSTYAAFSEDDQSDGDDKAVTITPSGSFGGAGTKDWNDNAGTLAQMLVGLTGVTTTTTITITPFLDNVVTDGLITANEVTGTPVTITFHKASEVTATTTLDTPVIGTDEISATVTLDKGINSASIPADSVKVAFGKDGGATSPAGATQAASWNSDDSVWESSRDSLNAVVADGDVYSAQATVAGATAGGNISYGSAASGTATNLAEPVFVASSNVLAGTNASLKPGSGSVVVSSTVTAPVKSGKTVTFKFTKSSLRTAASITVGGKTLNRASTSPITVEAITDADGKASVTVDYVGFVATATADRVTVQTSVLGAAAVISSGTANMTAVAPATQPVIDSARIGYQSERSIAKGGSTNVELHIVDQYGAPVTELRRLVYTITGETSNVEISHASNSTTTSGATSVTLTDVSTATSGTFDLNVLVQKVDADTGFWATDVSVAKVADFTMGQGVAATLTTTTAMAATTIEGSRLVLQTVATIANDGRKLALGTSYSGNGFQITGSVKSANGAPIDGQAVTVSAAGAGFSTNVNSLDAVYVKDSITVHTDSSGMYYVDAYSNQAGQVDYTVTSGATSKTTTAYFKKAASTSGSALVIDAPAFVTPGSTLMVKATLKDKFGNNVDADTTTNKLAISYAGPGLIVSTPTAFVDGALQFGVLLGTNDFGTATVTISAYESTLKIASSKSISVGAANVSTWTSNQNDGTVKMYAKNVIGAGKVQFMVNGEEIAWVRAASTADSKLRLAGAEGAAYLVRTVDLVEGQKNVLEIYVDGKRTTRSAYTY